MAEAPRFRLGPLERRGVVAGLRKGQVLCLGGGLLLAVVADRVLAPGPGLVAAIAVSGAALALATWPVGGRTAEEWLPVLARAAGSWVRRDARFRSGLPALGQLAARSGGGLAPGEGRARLVLPTGQPGRGRDPLAPAQVRACALTSAPLEGSTARIGVVEDRREGTLTAVVALGLPGFCLRGSEEQYDQVGSWAAVLAGLAREGSPVHRLQWVERVLPCPCPTGVVGPSPDPRSAHGGSGRVFAPRSDTGDDTGLLRSYERLVASVFEASERHQVLLAVALRPKGARRTGEGSLGLVGHVVRTLEDDLRAAGLPVAGALPPGALARCLRLAWERAGRLSSDPGVPAEGALAWPWPLSFDPHWSYVRTEGTFHATYWVAEWPRVAVRPDFLAPLVLHAGVRRTLSVVMEPLPPGRAAREAERARTEDLADAELRERGGFLATARRRREQESLLLRELELADGHAPYRFSGYVTVSADGLEHLEPACARVEQAAAQAGLELRRLYGDQDRAFFWTLPLGRGLS